MKPPHCGAGRYEQTNTSSLGPGGEIIFSTFFPALRTCSVLTSHLCLTVMESFLDRHVRLFLQPGVQTHEEIGNSNLFGACVALQFWCRSSGWELGVTVLSN